MANTSGQPESRGEKSKIIILLVGAIVIILFVYLLYTGGMTSVSDFLKRMLKWGLVLALFGLVAWVVFKLLQKPKIDLVENDRQDIIDAGILSKPPMVRDLYFTGDKDHGEFRVGRITGYVQLQSYKDLDLLAGLTKEQLREMLKNNEIPSQKIIREDCFVFKRFPFPFSVFEQPKVLRTFEDEHSQLIGDVKIYGVSMVRKFGYYWPNRGHLDIARIDIGIIREAWRGQVHQFLRDAVSIQQRAVGLDAEFKKELDRRKLLKIPSPLGSNEEQGAR
jgi:hypothetical protein